MGRVFVYKYNHSADSWDLFDTLRATRNQTNFGFSVDMYNGSIIVGANGFVEDQFENHEAFDSRLTRKCIISASITAVYFTCSMCTVSHFVLFFVASNLSLEMPRSFSNVPTPFSFFS